MILNKDHFTLKLAQTDAEMVAAQRLRYRVFVQEMGARPAYALNERETDAFDPFFDHLILKDERIENEQDNVVGVYRLMQGDVAKQGPGFYGAGEYDLSKLVHSKKRLVELGRSCVDAHYRGGLALHLLWQGVADYVVKNDIEILFGVASFAGSDVKQYSDGLSFLHHNHLAPEPLQVKAKADNAVSMNMKTLAEIDRPKAVRQIPSLIKSYLRLGGCVGMDAYVDHNFNTIDVCVVLDRAQVPNSQRLKLEQGFAA